jgi:hypothetical protein
MGRGGGRTTRGTPRRTTHLRPSSQEGGDGHEGLFAAQAKSGAPLPPQALQGPSFAGGRAGLPPHVEDSEPRERPGSHGGLMTLTTGALCPGGGSRPAGGVDGLSGRRRERRPQALRTAGSPSEPGRLATALHHGGHPGAAKPRLNRRPPGSSRAHGGRAAGSIDGTGARPRGTPGSIRRRAPPRLHRRIQRPDGRHGGLPLRRSGGDEEHGGGQHGLRCGHWYRVVAGRKPG